MRRTRIHINSIESYHEIDLSKKQGEVVSVLLEIGEATDKQIADYLGYTVNRVTGRITELQDKKVMVECGTVIGKFNKLVRVCRLRKLPPKRKIEFKETLF